MQYTISSNLAAFAYFKMAALGGSAEGMYKYATMLRQETNLKNHLEEAAKYYKMAADKGYVPSIRDYAILLNNGYGPKLNENEITKYF